MLPARLLLLSLGSIFAAAACSANAGSDAPGTSTGAYSESDEDKEALAKIRDAVKDVEQEHVTFADATATPKASAGGGFSGEGVSLFGVDWFQKWPGGVSADHDWSKGSEAGQRCMWAAVLRFEAIMKEPPAELKQFLSEYDKWRGSFYNWVDDYSKDESSGDASHARLWAWRTGLTKWISGAAKDGSCYLPTRTMVVEYVAACKEHAASNDGEMQGCSR